MSGMGVVDYGVHILASFAPCGGPSAFHPGSESSAHPAFRISAPPWRLCVSLWLSAGGEYTVWQTGPGVLVTAFPSVAGSASL